MKYEEISNKNSSTHVVSVCVFINSLYGTEPQRLSRIFTKGRAQMVNTIKCIIFTTM
jgi:hypothetical protein